MWPTDIKSKEPAFNTFFKQKHVHKQNLTTPINQQNISIFNKCLDLFILLEIPPSVESAIN